MKETGTLDNFEMNTKGLKYKSKRKNSLVKRQYAKHLKKRNIKIYKLSKKGTAISDEVKIVNQIVSIIFLYQYFKS